MHTLFPLEMTYPPGFRYQADFLTQEEEQQLIAQLQSIDLNPFVFRGYTANRRVASFGVDWRFDTQQLVTGKAVPDGFQWLVERVAAITQLAPAAFAELLVTEYPKGSVINWHRDAPPFDLIAGVSLAADCLFKLRPYEKELQGRSAVTTIPVARRSIYTLSGAARENWQHSIAPVSQTRYSITLRTLL